MKRGILSLIVAMSMIGTAATVSLAQDTADAFQFTVPADVQVDQIELIVSNFTSTDGAFARVRNFSGGTDFEFINGNVTFPNLITGGGPLGPGTYDLQIHDILRRCRAGFAEIGSVSLDYRFNISASSQTVNPLPLNYTEPPDLTSNLAAPDNLGSIGVGTNSVVGSIQSVGDPGPCPGACCHSNGSCTEVSAADCSAAGGAYLGDDIPCFDVTCEVQGACCDPLGVCTEGTEADCDAIDGGVYQGDGTDCASVVCPGLVPAVSEWGLLSMILIGLAVGTVLFRRWPRMNGA